MEFSKIFYNNIKIKTNNDVETYPLGERSA
jgi:hypothetical protein